MYLKSPVTLLIFMKVRETVKAYSAKLPVPGKQKSAPLRREDELADEIMDLKKALNSARQDLQMEKVRNRRQENNINISKKKQGWNST